MSETGLLPAAPDLEPIEQTPLRVQIADRLRRAIVTASCAPARCSWRRRWPSR